MLVPQAKGLPLFCSDAAAFAAFCELFAPGFDAVCGACCGFWPWISKVCATHALESASAAAKTGANEDNSRTLTRDEEIFTLAFFTALFKRGSIRSGQECRPACFEFNNSDALKQLLRCP